MFDKLRKIHFVQAVGVIVVGLVLLFLSTRVLTFFLHIVQSFIFWFTSSFLHLLMGAAGAAALLLLIYSAIRHSSHD